MLENGLEVCNCRKKNCVRHGKCAECLEHHKSNKKHPPYCKRMEGKTDRNITEKIGISRMPKNR